MKFLAFYRILPKAPAPVIPIFTDGVNAFRQICGHDDHVVEYRNTPDLSEERLVISNEVKISTPKIGAKAIYAYEYAENSITIGDTETLKGRLSSILKTEKSISKKLFSILDIAIFIENDELLKLAADNCYKSLNKFSPTLSEKWLNGAQLGFDIKEYVAKNNAKKKNDVKKEFTFTITCRKAVWKAFERNAAARKVSIKDYFELCADLTIGEGDFHEKFSTNDVEKIKYILISPDSKILTGHMEATARIIMMIRGLITERERESGGSILDHLIIDHAQEDGLTKFRSFRIKIHRDLERDVGRVSKKFHISRPEARGLILASILDKADPEFLSKVHALIKSKSDRLNKNLESYATIYFNKYINYIPDLPK